MTMAAPPAYTPRHKQGREDAMAEGTWRRVLTDCFTAEELKEWRAAKERLGPGFDHAGHAAAWADYNARVQAALPLDPDSEQTKAIVTEWMRCAPTICAWPTRR